MRNGVRAGEPVIVVDAIAPAAKGPKIQNAITSRLNHDVRQPRNARHALSGLPRCSNAIHGANAAANAAITVSSLDGSTSVAATLAPTPNWLSTSMKTSGR